MPPSIVRVLKRSAAVAAVCTATAVPLLAPGTAHAWWYRGGWGWGPGVDVAVPPVIVAPPPVYVVPRPVFVAPRPYARWIPPHYWRGVYIRGHWA